MSQDANLDPDDVEQPFYIHQWLDAQDSYKHWYEAQIVQLNVERNAIKVHYKGWKSKFDEWINLTNEHHRIAKLHTHTERPPHIGHVDLSVGMSLDVKDSTEKWYEGQVMDLTERLAKIHYKGWGEKFDEWINRDSYRLAPLHSTTTPSTSGSPNKRPAKSSSTTARSQQQRTGGSSNPGTTISSSVRRNSGPSAGRRFDDDAVVSLRGDIRQVDESAFHASEQNEADFRALLATKHWQIENMGEDGNCLFRSISHQVYGTEDYHAIVRLKCVEYLEQESAYFSNFVEGDDEHFLRYCAHMKRNAVWGGNIEIQAFSEMYQRRIEIYAYSDTPMKTFSNEHISTTALIGQAVSLPPIRLSYHFNSHYNSIIEPRKHELFTTKTPPGELEDERIRMSRLRSRDALESTTQLSDIEATSLQIYADALNESRRLFQEENLLDQRQFDEVLVRSLNDYNQSNLQQGIIESLQQQEVHQIVQMEQEEYKQALAASLAEAWPRPVQAMISLGFSLEEALQAHTVFEGMTTFGEDELIEKMRDYLLAIRQSAAFESGDWS